MKKTRDLKYFIKSSLGDNLHETAEGYLVALNVPIGRTGEQEYLAQEVPDLAAKSGKLIAERDEEEVFRPETMASFEGKPLTVDHPAEDVNPKNWKRHAVGVIQNVRRGDSTKGDRDTDLMADILIQDAQAIQLVKGGLREISCGYDTQYEELEPGRARQTNIHGNHVALVRSGRAGPDYAIRDHATYYLNDNGDIMKNKETLMDKIKSIFGKAQDDALKLVVDAEEPAPEKKEMDMGALCDAMEAMSGQMKDLVASVSAMGQPTISKKEGDEEKPAEEPKKDADPMEALGERIAALEAICKKLMGEEGEDALPAAEAKEEKADELPMEAKKEDEEKEEMKKEDEEAKEEGKLVGDAAAHDALTKLAEELSPEIEIISAGESDPCQAMRDFALTQVGKAYLGSVVDSLDTALADPAQIRLLVKGAAREMKKVRNEQLASVRAWQDAKAVASGTYTGGSKPAPTPEELNRKAAEFYKKVQ